MAFLPLVMKLGEYLKLAGDHYAMLKSAGGAASPDMVAMFIRTKIQSWDPKVGQQSLLDDATRDAAARFLAGVAVNLAGNTK